MFRSYSLSVTDNEFQSGLYELGLTGHSRQKSLVRKSLSSFLLPDGSLLASKMIDKWFPEIKADVFISHSHIDSTLAIQFAGYLYETHGLTCFIDSCAWGFSDTLLRTIDDAFCYDSVTRTYLYEMRNRSTSHVHMMLATALTKMMDETECVIFMNTPRSISSGDYVKGTPTTGSPWIYYELAMSRLIRTRPPERNLPMLKVESASLRKALRIVYEVDLKHLTPLSAPDLNAWSKASKTSKKGASRLDQLYSIT